MKTKMTAAGRNFCRMMIAACFIFSVGAAAAAESTPAMRAAALQAMPAAMPQGTVEHCGCDNPEGIARYVKSLVNDAQRRNKVCESANTHIPACITVWCSICKGHAGLVEECIKNGFAQLAPALGQCQQTPALSMN